MRSVIAGLALALMMASPAAVAAGYNGPMRFITFLPCAGSSCAPRVLAEGTIEYDTANELRAYVLARQKRRAGEKGWLAASPTICFDSPGGSLAGGILLGEMIRRMRLNTCLAPRYTQIRTAFGTDETLRAGVKCASACAFAFVGGIRREVADGSAYGFHQFSSENTDAGESATQITVVLLASYLDLMGIPRSFLDESSLVPPNQVKWLRKDEIIDYRVDNQTLIHGRWELSATADGQVRAHVRQIQVWDGTGNTVQLVVSRSRNRGPYLAIMQKLNNPYSNDADYAIDALSGVPVELFVDGRMIATQVGKWDKLGPSALATVVSLTERQAIALTSGAKLELRVEVGHTRGAVDPSMTFDLKGGRGPLLAALQ
jgi:hypothetical protein